MKTIRKIFLVVTFTLILPSCNIIPPKNSLDTKAETNTVPSPFSQFEYLEMTTEMGIDSEQVDNILRTYDIYERIMEIITETGYAESHYSDVSISGFNIGNKKVAVLLIEKGHLYIYVMFSNINDKWAIDGFTYQNERFKPVYRIEQSSDRTKYWLVIKHEANHGTGLQIFNEIWYNPDGTIAADYPIEGFTEFFPQMIKPAANAEFSASTYYDGISTISLSYSISFIYHYKDNKLNKDGLHYFKCEYNPVIREYWEYNLKKQQLVFSSSEPALPESLRMVNHESSAEFGILQGYIDFYSIQLSDKTISTLEEWEIFIGHY